MPDALRTALQSTAQMQTYAAGEVICYQGDPADQLQLVIAGTCQISVGLTDQGIAEADTVLDIVATLGGLPHQVKVTAREPVTLHQWRMDDLWQMPQFAAYAHQYMAQRLLAAEQRRDELAAPLHHLDPYRATLPTDSFLFEEATLIFAFCRVRLDFLRPLVPDELSILQIFGGDTAPLLIAFADFPVGYPEHNPAATFGYRETTFFVPIRYQTAFGLYVSAIVSSAYEPILIGRETYGFPKQIGDTRFATKQVALEIGTTPALQLAWQSAVGSSETDLIRALSDWLGVAGRVTAAAFSAGELLRKLTRLPAFRRVDVYNHKCIPAADSTADAPRYEVNALTRTTFGVLQWRQITRLNGLALQPMGDFWAGSDLHIQAAYRTQLDMRLGTGRVVINYGEQS